jgi:hypothetical protein
VNGGDLEAACVIGFDVRVEPGDGIFSDRYELFAVGHRGQYTWCFGSGPPIFIGGA